MIAAFAGYMMAAARRIDSTNGLFANHQSMMSLANGAGPNSDMAALGAADKAFALNNARLQFGMQANEAMEQSYRKLVSNNIKRDFSLFGGGGNTGGNLNYEA